MKALCLAIFILSAAVLAQPQTAPKPAIVEGKVVSSTTGEPLRKVELTLTTNIASEDMEAMIAMFGGGSDAPPGPKTPKAAKKTFAATTDAAGKFQLDQVEPGDYFLSAKRAGYVDGQYKPEGKYAAAGKVRLAAGDTLTDVVFRLVPQGALAGRLIDEDGDPVAAAFVTAQSYNYGSGRRRLMTADSAQTSDRGEFRLGKLPPGRYYLSANAFNMNPLAEVPPPPKDGSPETGYVSTYYPSATDPALATAIDVAAGADLGGFTIQLRKSKVVRIRGKALAADGTPLKNFQVMLMSPGNPTSMQMRMVSNAEGRFEIANVQPGSYTVTTMQLEGSSPSIHMQPLVVPAEGLDNVQLGAQPEGTVQGSVLVSGDAKVSLTGLMVMIAGGEDDLGAMPVMGKVSESGAFALKKVGALPYDLSLQPVPSGTYLKSVQWGGRERLGQTLDFTAGFAGTLQIVLGTDGGDFEAAVSRDDKPAAGATVVLLAADPAGRFPETTESGYADSTGHVKLTDVPPGDYLAFAWEKVEHGQWLDLAFLKPFENQAARVTVHPKGHETAQLTLIPAAQ
jgi:hypothetical protein